MFLPVQGPGGAPKQSLVQSAPYGFLNHFIHKSCFLLSSVNPPFHFLLNLWFHKGPWQQALQAAQAHHDDLHHHRPDAN